MKLILSIAAVAICTGCAAAPDTRTYEQRVADDNRRQAINEFLRVTGDYHQRQAQMYQERALAPQYQAPRRATTCTQEVGPTLTMVCR